MTRHNLKFDGKEYRFRLTNLSPDKVERLIDSGESLLLVIGGRMTRVVVKSMSLSTASEGVFVECWGVRE